RSHQIRFGHYPIAVVNNDPAMSLAILMMKSTLDTLKLLGGKLRQYGFDFRYTAHNRHGHVGQRLTPRQTTSASEYHAFPARARSYLKHLRTAPSHRHRTCR